MCTSAMEEPTMEEEEPVEVGAGEDLEVEEEEPVEVGAEADEEVEFGAAAPTFGAGEGIDDEEAGDPDVDFGAPAPLFGVDASRKLPTLTLPHKPKELDPEAYLNHYMRAPPSEVDKRANDILATLCKLRAESVNTLRKLTNASQKAAPSHDDLLKLFRAAEEFCILLIPLGYYAFDNDNALTNQKRMTLQIAYYEHLSHKVDLVCSSAFQPVLEFARMEYGLVAM